MCGFHARISCPLVASADVWLFRHLPSSSCLFLSMLWDVDSLEIQAVSASDLVASFSCCVRLPGLLLCCCLLCCSCTSSPSHSCWMVQRQLSHLTLGLCVLLRRARCPSSGSWSQSCTLTGIPPQLKSFAVSCHSWSTSASPALLQLPPAHPMLGMLPHSLHFLASEQVPQGLLVQILQTMQPMMDPLLLIYLSSLTEGGVWS